MAIKGYPELGIPPSQIGDATHCWKPVFLNLALTDGLTLWLEWIFLSMYIAQFTKADLAATVGKFKHFVFLLGSFVLFVALGVPDLPTECLIFVYALLVRFHSFRMYIATYADDEFLIARADDSMLKTTGRLVITGLLKLYLIPHGEEEHLHQE
jgi:hypothetical protein